MKSRVLLAACLLLACATLRAATMEVVVEGVSDEALENVLAFLGDAPQTVEERSNFSISARRQVELALEALGYYRPVIDLTIEREGDP